MNLYFFYPSDFPQRKNEIKSQEELWEDLYKMKKNNDFGDRFLMGSSYMNILYIIWVIFVRKKK